jgi:hypothetical protein
MNRVALLMGGITLLAGCSREQVPTENTAQDHAGPAVVQQSAAREQNLKTLRRVTEPFKVFAVADSSGYSAQITPCMSDPTLGGMGFHYGNVGLIDGAVQVDQPELLLYEPQANGALSLVAVEYIIPYTFVPRDAPAPTLFGEQFLQNDTFQLWGLHVWVWKHNPSGLFASWNPQVSCANTTNVSTMSHH